MPRPVLYGEQRAEHRDGGAARGPWWAKQARLQRGEDLGARRVGEHGEKAPPLFGRQTMSVYPFRMSSEIRTYYTKVYLSASIPKDE